MAGKILRINFVCAGNICRSVMAANVARSIALEMNLQNFEFSSSGTGAWHEGQDADHRTHDVLSKAGYPEFDHRARKYQDSWSDQLDLIVAMDRSNYSDLARLPNLSRTPEKLLLLRNLDGNAMSSQWRQGSNLDVPDPYFGNASNFEDTLKIVELGVGELLKRLSKEMI